MPTFACGAGLGGGVHCWDVGDYFGGMDSDYSGMTNGDVGLFWPDRRPGYPLGAPYRGGDGLQIGFGMTVGGLEEGYGVYFYGPAVSGAGFWRRRPGSLPRVRICQRYRPLSLG